MEQAVLWHDAPEDALRDTLAAVYGRGWSKKAAAEMWPTADPVDQAKYLEKCLNAERGEKLGLAELVWILQRGRRADVHIFARYLGEAAGYAVEPIDPEDERARLQREYCAAVRHLAELSRRLERLTVPVREAG